MMSPRVIKVLLVDDDEDDYLITEDMFSQVRNIEFKLSWTTDFDAALNSMIYHTHDAYLVDYRLGGVNNGLDLIHRAIEAGCQAPIILLTGQGDQEVDMAAMAAGAADYLVKGDASVALLERSVRYAIERKRAEAASQHLATIVESSDDAIISLNLKRHILSWNPGASRLYGYQAADIIDQPIALLTPPNRQSEIDQLLASIQQGGRITNHETVHQRQDGRLVDVSLTISPIYNRSGQVMGASIISRDITAQKQALERLRHNEALLRLVTDYGHDMVALHDADGRYLYVSPAFERLLGYAKDDLLDANPYEFFHPDDIVRIRQESHQPILEGQPLTQISYRFRHQDGHYVWLETFTQPIFDERNRLTHLVTNSRNITERKQAEAAIQEAYEELEDRVAERTETLSKVNKVLHQQIKERQNIEAALRESENRFRTLTETTSAGILIVEEMRILYANQAAERLLGYSQAEFESLNLTKILQTDIRQLIASQNLTETTLHDMRWQTELQLTRRDGESRWVELSIMPAMVNNHPVLILTLLDLTDQKNAEELLRQANETLEQRVTERTAELRSTVELLEREIQEHQRTEAALLKSEDSLRQERSQLAARVRERTRELSLVNEQLIRAARLKDEFLANMSHELRTPLNAILGMSEILLEGMFGILNERQYRYVKTIEDSGRHLLNLINDILDLSKMEAGMFDLAIATTSMESICSVSLQFIRQMALKKEIVIETIYDPQVTTIQADELRLKQILVNLLTNAVKFTPAGGQVGLEVTGDVENGFVLFSVWDTGIGIAESDLDRLFQTFVQLDAGLNRAQEGTGLGLSLVYRLAELHGGSISVTSQVGHGSRFTVRLPWQPAASQTVPQAAESFADASLEKFLKADMVILLVEDNPSNIELVYDYLDFLGCQIHIAHNGLEALTMVHQQKPDLILMDIQMPGMDGLEATRQIRVHYGPTELPIIAVTALAMPGDRERCLEAGANDYLIKPIKIRELKAKIEALME